MASTASRTHCAVCGSPPAVLCPRCGRALCFEHGPRDASHRCIDCELEYARGRRAGLGFDIAWGLLLLALLTGAGVLGLSLDRAGYLIARGGGTAYAQFAVYASLGIGVVAAALAVRGVRSFVVRRRFLGERAGRGQAVRTR